MQKFFRILPSFDYRHLITQDRSQLLTKALFLRLVRHGAVQVSNCGEQSLSTLSILVDQILSPPMKTIWSRSSLSQSSIEDNMWTVEAKETDDLIKSDDVSDDVYTRKELLPHNDCLYLDEVPGLQIFYSLKVDPVENRGLTILTDSKDVLKFLPADSRAILSGLSLRYRCAESFDTTAIYPIISKTLKINEFGEDVSLLYNRYDIVDRETLSHRENAELKSLEALIDKCSWNFLLKEGSMLIINNQRMMHGRTALSKESKRTLLGCYVDKDSWQKRLSTLLK
jgi:alpha-ketoglutarate-dependent taurine dioxygenase